MTEKNMRAFTLIELLVVVLIIGILAAVALPQYQRAVEKSRATQALAMLKTVSQAAQAYYLAHGEYPDTFAQMDVSIPWTGSQKRHAMNIKDTKSNEDWSLQIYDNGSAWLLMLGRISGPYAGAGFSADNRSNFQIVCAEDAASSSAFRTFYDNIQPAGAYCEKIFNGTLIDPDNTYRTYTLP